MNLATQALPNPEIIESRLRTFCNSLEGRLRGLSLDGATTACGTTERDEPNYAAFGHYGPAHLKNIWAEIRYPDCVVSIVHKTWRDAGGRQYSTVKGYVSELAMNAIDFPTQRAALEVGDQIARRFGRFELPSVNYHQLSFDFDETLASALYKGLERLGRLERIAA